MLPSVKSSAKWFASQTQSVGSVIVPLWSAVPVKS